MHSESLINLYGDMVSVSLNEFINDRVYDGVVNIQYYILTSNLTNAFVNNRAAYDLFISSYCKPGFSRVHDVLNAPETGIRVS